MWQKGNKNTSISASVNAAQSLLTKVREIWKHNQHLLKAGADQHAQPLRGLQKHHIIRGFCTFFINVPAATPGWALATGSCSRRPSMAQTPHAALFSLSFTFHLPSPQQPLLPLGSRLHFRHFSSFFYSRKVSSHLNPAVDTCLPSNHTPAVGSSHSGQVRYGYTRPLYHLAASTPRLWMHLIWGTQQVLKVHVFSSFSFASSQNSPFSHCTIPILTDHSVISTQTSTKSLKKSSSIQ